jgi:ribosomal protein S18 acetylase RimI-like enzyme
VTPPPSEPPPGPTARETFTALATCYLALARHVVGPGVVLGARDGIVYGAVGTDLPDFNRIMQPDTEGAPSNEVIEAVMSELAGSVALSWWMPPGPWRAVLERRLAAHGLGASRSNPDVPAMAIALDDVPPVEPLADLEIEMVATGPGAYEAGLVSAAGFGTSGSTVTEMAEICGRIGDRPDGPSRYLLARLEGRPIATAIGVVAGDAVGIYSVATLPEARGQGIGRAITLATMLDGRERGARIAVLESSPMGYRVYRRLGFRDVGGFRVLVRHRPDIGPA